MPDPAEVVADEPEVKEPVEAEAEPEGVVAEADQVAEAEAEGAAEPEVDPVQAKIDAAVNKALESQATKLGEARKAAEAAARLEAERDFYKQEVERSRNPKKEIVEEPIKLPNGFDLLPQEAQDDYLAEKRLRRDAMKEIEALKAERNQEKQDSISSRIDSAIDAMKADTENYPGFAEVFPQIEDMGRKDPAFLYGVKTDPKKYLRMAYKDLTSERAPVLAEKELEKKIQKQIKARTTRPGVRDTGGSVKASGIDAIMEKAWTEAGGSGDE